MRAISPRVVPLRPPRWFTAVSDICRKRSPISMLASITWLRAHCVRGARMLRNAPYLTRTVEFLVPCFSHFDQFYYGLGMKMYDWISGKSSLLPSRMLTREEALYRMPAMQSKSLIGAVAYADGQFDDARYAVAILETFDGLGGAA